MDINLNELYSGVLDTICIDRDILFAQDTYHIKDIEKLSDVHLKGEIAKNDQNEVILTGVLSGVMTILDSISLEEVNYPFSIELEENLDEIVGKGKNSIDILDILWQNIVLEVPLRYTEVTDYSKYSGDGWRLISEEELKYENNPFQALLKNEKEE